MPAFGVRFTAYENAHPPKGQKPLSYEQWETVADIVFTNFNEAKEWARAETEYSIPRDFSRFSWEQNELPQTQYLAFKLPPEQDFTVREEERIAKGEYELLPEHMRPEGAYYSHMYPRLTDKKMIAYYDSIQDARNDRLAEVKPTRFFCAYFDEDRGWDYMAELGLIANEVGLTFLTTREDIRFAYENGPESCMSGMAERYQSPYVHPVEAYASPDLALAVLYRGNDWRESIVARAICNQNTKEYVRIYGDKKRMEKMLAEQGYLLNSYSLGGCRLLKIFGRDYDDMERERKNIIMVPYLDGKCKEVLLSSFSDEFMVIKPQPIILCGTECGYNDVR